MLGQIAGVGTGACELVLNDSKLSGAISGHDNSDIGFDKAINISQGMDATTPKMDGPYNGGLTPLTPSSTQFYGTSPSAIQFSPSTPMNLTQSPYNTSGNSP